jgi:hypothetical protein
MENIKNATVINGKIVPKWNHEPPRAAIVAWCPHCLSYGGPMGIEDRICGNCGIGETRMYQEVLHEIISEDGGPS